MHKLIPILLLLSLTIISQQNLAAAASSDSQSPNHTKGSLTTLDALGALSLTITAEQNAIPKKKFTHGFGTHTDTIPNKKHLYALACLKREQHLSLLGRAMDNDNVLEHYKNSISLFSKTYQEENLGLFFGSEPIFSSTAHNSSSQQPQQASCKREKFFAPFLIVNGFELSKTCHKIVKPEADSPASASSDLEAKHAESSENSSPLTSDHFAAAQGRSSESNTNTPIFPPPAETHSVSSSNLQVAVTEQLKDFSVVPAGANMDSQSAEIKTVTVRREPQLNKTLQDPYFKRLYDYLSHISNQKKIDIFGSQRRRTPQLMITSPQQDTANPYPTRNSPSNERCHIEVIDKTPKPPRTLETAKEKLEESLNYSDSLTLLETFLFSLNTGERKADLKNKYIKDFTPEHIYEYKMELARHNRPAFLYPNPLVNQAVYDYEQGCFIKASRHRIGSSQYYYLCSKSDTFILSQDNKVVVSFNYCEEAATLATYVANGGLDRALKIQKELDDRDMALMREQKANGVLCPEGEAYLQKLEGLHKVPVVNDYPPPEVVAF